MAKDESKRFRKTLFTRWSANPLLTPAQWPYDVNSVFNCGATRLASGETLLLCRVEERSGRSHFCVARSADGRTNWQIEPQPTLLPQPQEHPEEAWGIEDPRIVWVEQLKQYVITYTCYSPSGPGVSLALTKDFRSFERLGVVLPPENKDAALFPRRLQDRWALIHRPVSTVSANIWISFSPDLKHWGDHSVLLPAKKGPWWDAGKVGLSPPPIETPEGWLIIYHGMRDTLAGCLYRLGLALLDLENPTKLLCRGTNWIFGPETDYEALGDVGNVVFPCGYTIGDDGDSLSLYYGAADRSIALAQASIKELLSWLKTDGESSART